MVRILPTQQLIAELHSTISIPMRLFPLFFFSGVPSPARLKQMQDADSDAMNSTIVSPIVHVIPLLSKESCSVGNG
jgi:hypothetical protein